MSATQLPNYVMTIHSDSIASYSLWVNLGTVSRMASEILQSPHLAESAKEELTVAVQHLAEAYLKHGVSIRKNVTIDYLQ